MANTKITSRVLADDAVGIDQLNISNSYSSGQVLGYSATSGDLQWETVSGTTINTNADNRIITGSGTANTLNGESTLTFDGNNCLKIIAAGNTTNGGNIQLGITTDDTAKYTAITANQHDSGTETEGFLLIGGNSAGNDSNLVNIGGGFGEANPATQIQFYTGSAATREGTNRMVIDPSGFVGIGTTTPSSYNSYGDNLVVADSAHCGISIVAGTTSQSTLMFADGTGGTAGYRGRVGYDHNEDKMVFHTAAAEAMRIASTGQVLINATNANYPTDYATTGTVATTIIRGPETAATDNALFVYGGRIALNAHPARYATRAYIQSDGGGMKIWHTDNSDMIFAVNNSEKVRIQYSDGIIKCFGIYAHATSGTVRDVYIEDGGQLGYSSSVKAHKTNITDYNDASWLYNLNPKQFNRRKKNMVIETNDDGVDHTVHDGTYSDTEFHTPVEVGFLAEDVEALDSKLCFYDVVTDEDGNESEQLAGIHYKNMVAPMLKLIQEQKTLIDDLTARIETLEG